MNMNHASGTAAALEAASHRLATYGTLAPGRPNHHQLDGVKGRWSRGHVRGRLTNAGWGASLGYPALILDPDGSAIQVHVFESTDLPAHWSRLDQFEGPGYQRVLTSVHTPLGQVDAFIYALPARDQGLTAGRTPVQLRRALAGLSWRPCPASRKWQDFRLFKGGDGRVGEAEMNLSRPVP
jgi:gamma-glutamylcyclotransferase (GGCT)/AIG2-like uncharacterized protein YtfP